ncbi:MAG: RluA family pseudouridine synthase [Bdellovibrionota bacterium]
MNSQNEYTDPTGEHKIPILFEDNDLLVVSKPAGLPTQSTVDKRRANLYDLLRDSRRWPYLGLHHRLDVPTSGVLLLVKNRDYNKAIAEGFRDRTIHKTYYCLCRGLIPWDEIVVENHLKQTKLKNGKTKMTVVNSGGDWAKTEFKVLGRSTLETESSALPLCTLVEAKPLTGRMHQIRIHLSSAGFPILGDALYGSVIKDIKRLMLHAAVLKFIHPRTNKEMTITSPIPADLRTLLKKQMITAP